MALLTNTSGKNFIKSLQLNTIKRYDDKCDEIVCSANEVSVFFYEKSTNVWLQDNLQGAFFLYRTNDDDRKYSLIILNNNLLIDMKSYSIHHLCHIDLCLEDKFIKIDNTKGDYCLGLHFLDNDHASSIYTNLHDACCVCKGVDVTMSPEHTKCIELSVNETKTVAFSTCYSNKPKLDLYVNPHTLHNSTNNNLTNNTNKYNRDNSTYNNGNNSNRYYSNNNNNNNNNNSYNNYNNNQNNTSYNAYNYNKRNYDNYNRNKPNNFNNTAKSTMSINNSDNWRKMKKPN